MKINDEILCAYIDGELTAEDRSAVERALEKSPEISQRIEEIRNIDSLFSKTFRAVDNTPMPENVLSTLRDFPQKHAIDGAARFEAIPTKDAVGPGSQLKSFWHIAAAASVLLIIGAGFGRTLSISEPNENQAHDFVFAQQTVGIIGPENVLFNILEKEPSGSLITINHSNETIVNPIMTFQNGENNYCREFDIATPTEGTKNIACRGGDSVWTVEVAVKVSSPSFLANDLYQTATTDDEPIIDAMVRQMIKGDVLGIDAETLLIEQNWP